MTTFRDRAQKLDSIVLSTFGEFVLLHHRGGINRILAILWEPDKSSMIGTVNTDFEDIRAEISCNDASMVNDGDRIEIDENMYVIYDISDDDMESGLVSLWLRRECNAIST